MVRFARFVPILLVTFMVCTLALWGQGHSPSDTNGAIHRADPCALTPDNASGVQNDCKFGWGSGIARADINGDGIADLIVGVPNETRTNITFQTSGCCTITSVVTDEAQAGAVNIFLGSSTGLTTAGSQVLDQYLSGVTANSHFGAAVTPGQFREPIGSPYSDLAVAAPGAPHGGAVYLFYNFGGGLPAKPSDVIFGNDFTGAGTVLGSFGGLLIPPNPSMTWGDFNGDGFGDLVFEVNTCTLCTSPRSAWVVVYGGPLGLDKTTAEVMAFDDGLSQNNFNTSGASCSARFCAISRGHVSLTSADLDGDGKDELLVGAPGCSQINDSGSILRNGIGCVAIIRGTAPALGRFGFDGWVAIAGTFNNFGTTLAVGDFNGDSSLDVAIGSAGTSTTFGSVTVVPSVKPGSGQFLVNTTGAVSFNQSSPGLGGAQAGSGFGATLAASDFNGDGLKDLAIGAPNETVNGNAASGEVYVIFGSSLGLATAAGTGHPAAQIFLGDSGSHSGSALSAWNFGNGSQSDLAIGEPFFDIPIFFFNPTTFQISIIGHIDAAGGVRVLFGSSTGLGSAQFWTQNASGLNDSAAAGNHFGAAIY